MGIIPVVDEGLGNSAYVVDLSDGGAERAMSAASLRQPAGHDDVAVLAGGPDELGEHQTGAKT